MTDIQTAGAVASKSTSTWVLVGGGAALAGLGLAAGLMMRAPSPSTAPQDSAPVAAASSVASAALAATDTPAASAAADNRPPAAGATPAEAEPAPAKAATKTAQAKSHTGASTRVAQPAHSTEARTAAPHVICADCGVIESVTPIQQQVPTSGVGAVAGGVLGGVVGNQMGKGSGKTAMTVLGAIGGGLAGNEIEKRQRSETVYEVRIRMDNGGVRTFTERTAPSTGSRVRVNEQGYSVTSGQ